MDSRFVGAPNNTATPFCAGYVMFLLSFGYSGMFALLPLTIDRAVAVLSPLRHSSIITKKACLIMFLATWLSIATVLVDNIVMYEIGTLSVVYSAKYHRCVMLGKGFFVQNIILFVIPFFSVLLTYALMFAIILKTKRSCGQFLTVSAVIIATNLIAYSPTVIVEMTESIEMSYEVSQVMFATLWYTNGVTNPLLYVATHPKTREDIKLCLLRRNRRVRRASVQLSGIDAEERVRRISRISLVSPVSPVCPARDSVSLPNMNLNPS